jgi:hypothetical protein
MKVEIREEGEKSKIKEMIEKGNTPKVPLRTMPVMTTPTVDWTKLPQ